MLRGSGSCRVVQLAARQVLVLKVPGSSPGPAAIMGAGWGEGGGWLWL